MDDEQIGNVPAQCPVCQGDLLVTRLQCSQCATEVNGTFALGRLATTPEPHASLIEMFLRVRGNMKEMERELGLSYPTVRARLEEALEAAGFEKSSGRSASPGNWESRFEEDLAERIRSRVEERLSGLTERIERSVAGRVEREEEARRSAEARAERAAELAQRRTEILDQVERGEISADEAARLLRELKERR
jgi:hypothetical protein